MPPPTTIEKDIGERRVVGFAGCGLSPGPELDVAALVPPHGRWQTDTISAWGRRHRSFFFDFVDLPFSQQLPLNPFFA